MKLQKILCAVLLLFIIATCKEKEDNVSADAADKLAEIINVESMAAEIYGDTLKATNDTILALNAAGEWLIDQPEVAEVYYRSGGLIDITFNNGLKSSLLFVQSANGQVLYRGDGGGGSLKEFYSAHAISTEKIRNNKVLVLNPFLGEFNYGSYTKRPLFDGGPEEMDVTILNEDAVRYSVLSTLSDYGFIILNTHGHVNGFFLKKLVDIPFGETGRWTREDILNELNEESGVPLEKFENGELILNMRVRLDNDPLLWKKSVVFLITDKFIRNASLDLQGAVVFGNHCYSGYTAEGANVNNLPEAWRSKGAASYYGYAFVDNSSAAVSNPFASAMEDSLIINLVREGDSTGIAHLAMNTTLQRSEPVTALGSVPVLPERGPGSMVFTPAPDPVVVHGPFQFRHFFEVNYSYDKCGDTLLDGRDQQKYATVCIGDQVWMAENLNWAGAGECYDNNSGNCDTYGRLYSIQELTGTTYSETNPSGIQGICPLGWHVPSEAEWREMADFITDTHSSGVADVLRSTNFWPAGEEGTDAVGFKMLPGGYVNIGPTYHQYTELGEYAHIWTSSSSNPNTPKAIVVGPGYFVYLGYQVQTTPHYDWKFSCRCVKD